LNYGDLIGLEGLCSTCPAPREELGPLSRLAGSASPASPIPPRREGRAGGNYGRIK